jgi:hypothetical protein
VPALCTAPAGWVVRRGSARGLVAGPPLGLGTGGAEAGAEGGSKMHMEEAVREVVEVAGWAAAALVLILAVMALVYGPPHPQSALLLAALLHAITPHHLPELPAQVSPLTRPRGLYGRVSGEQGPAERLLSPRSLSRQGV